METFSEPTRRMSEAVEAARREAEEKARLEAARSRPEHRTLGGAQA